MLMVPPPERPWAFTENWFESPSTGPLIGRVFISSRTEGEPRRSISAWLSTATGMAVSFGVPAINEPVTTTSSTAVGVLAAVWALADPANAAAAAKATADALQIYLVFIIWFFLPIRARPLLRQCS